MVRSISMKSIISRIRWKVVIPLLAFILLLVLSLWFFNPLTPAYKCSENICVKLRATPQTVSLQGESTIWVNIENIGSSGEEISVFLESDDQSIIFTDTCKQYCNDSINLASGNSRNLDFDAIVAAEYGGEYGINVDIKFDNTTLEEKIFLNVVKG